MADLQSSWHVEITSIGPGGYVFYYEDNVEPIKCWWDYSVTIAQIDLPAAASWDSTYRASGRRQTIIERIGQGVCGLQGPQVKFVIENNSICIRSAKE